MPAPKKTRKSSRRAMRGGHTEACLTAFFSVIPGNYDYENMQENESPSVNSDKTYQEFVDYQTETVKALSADDCIWLMGLIKRMETGKITLQDPDSSTAKPARMLFFNTTGNLVVVNDP